MKAHTLTAINPATGQTIKQYTGHTKQQCAEIVTAVDNAQQNWRTESYQVRAKLLNALSDVLLKNKNEYAALITQEMGKPLKASLSEIEKCALNCRYFAEHGEQLLKSKHVQTEAYKSYVAYEPLGVILAIMPWNFPFWQVFRFLAPTLMAGNAAVLKHASNTPGCAVMIESIIQEAGFPKDIFRTLLVPSSEVVDIIAHPAIRAVTLTGSTEAGKAVAAQAGAHIKKTVLELGGSDPYVVLEDADVASSAKICAESRLLNAGQSCISAKRFIVMRPLLKQFTEAMVSHFKAQIVGDPMQENTTMGPMSRVDLRNQLHDQVQRSISQGAECILGGEIPEGEGAYYPPTILISVKPGMVAFDEELFGPVAPIIAAENEQEALMLANKSNYGLGAVVFTEDKARGEEIARTQLQAGSCYVNALIRSDPRLPFGGIKESGYGRELAEYGIHEFVNIKTVYVA